MRTFKVVFLLAFLTIIAGSCKKGFLDINDDPNRITEQNVTPEVIFPQAEHAVGARAASRNFEFLDNWLGYFAPSGSYAIDQQETSYNLDFSSSDAIWANHYNVLFDLHITHEKALEKGDYVLAAASTILATKLWQELVDMFGNIPYSQAFNFNKYQQPAYDKAQDVYASLLAKLDEASDALKTHEKFSNFTTLDLINGGDIAQWQRFANTLRLRLLIRQSQVPGFNPTAELAKTTSDGFLGTGQTIDVNPGYSNEDNKQSPFYANYGLTPAGNDANNIARANQYFVNLLGVNNDPRLKRFFKALGSGNVVGNTYGLAAGNPPGGSTSTIGPGLAGSATQSQWILTSVESKFLVAEATARGWLSGSDSAAYAEAVKESFLWLGNTSSEATAYLGDAGDWANAGTTQTSKIKFIAYQKYIALAGIDPLESYSDVRRLNMLPDNGYISVNPNRLSNTLPVRLPYPQTEYTTNAPNVNAQGSINIFTSKIFWQP